MTDMVEKVAVALWLNDAQRAAPNVAKYRNAETFREQPDRDIAAWLGQARAAIEAMREPTAPMIDRFVSRALCVSVHGEGGWSEYAKAQWQTMIDAALSQSGDSNSARDGV